MTTDAAAPAPAREDPRRVRRGFLRLALAVLVAVAGATSLAGAAVWRTLHVGSETDALRRVAAAHIDEPLRKVVEVRAGWCLLGVARAAVGLAEEAEPKARAILGAVRGVEAAVYEVSEGASRPPASALKDIDRAMEGRGLSRVLAVVDRDAFVVAYASGPGKGGELRLRVLTCAGGRVVAAGARVDADRLAEAVGPLLARAAEEAGVRAPVADQER